MGGGATLATHGKSVAAREENFGYCPGGCGKHRIGPGNQLQGFIAYDAFGDVQAIAQDAHKQLAYKVSPYLCAK
ncbi:hypothetical protein Y886_32735 [Xanthomonas hyacinthi DSM 19077]|nr:hypothetical protein Y886_32735 [Xanthomonas hyacinthi DSM 19077]